MNVFRRSGRSFRPGAAAPLTALALCATSLVLTTPAHADTSPGGTDPATAAPRIVGGYPVEPLFHTWIVQLIHKPATSSSDFCGGALIAPTKVLTAGYCVAGRDWVHDGKVVVNSATAGGDAGSTTVGVRAQWVQPGYKLADSGLTADNDLAILTLDRPLGDGYSALPEPSQTYLYEPGANPATVYGWGATDSRTGSTNAGVSLQGMTADINADGTCAGALNTATGDPHAYVPGHMVCIGAGGTGDDSTGTTTCVGDTGDPVVSGGGYLIGVVSRLGLHTSTQDCNVPGAYDVVTKGTTYFADVHAQINSTDVTRDGRADILARTPAGASYLYASTGTGYKSRVPAPISLTNYDTVVQADFDLDGYQDFVLRAAGTGNVFTARRTATNATYKYTLAGRNWKPVRAIVAFDRMLFAEDSSGRVWRYFVLADGTLSAPFATQTNWKRYNLVVGHGDYNGDGLPDVLARDAASGGLYLLRGSFGNAYIPFPLPPVLISAGWNGYDKLDAVGDYNGDGHPDLLARTPSGALFLHKGTGRTGPGTLAPAVKLGTGWNMYNLLG